MNCCSFDIVLFLLMIPCAAGIVSSIAVSLEFLINNKFDYCNLYECTLTAISYLSYNNYLIICVFFCVSQLFCFIMVVIMIVQLYKKK